MKCFTQHDVSFAEPGGARPSSSTKEDQGERGENGMATIRDLKLRLIDHSPKDHSATIRISYTAILTSLERDFAGLQFKEKIQLCGAFSLDPEDFLYELATETFTGSGDDTVERERLVTVSDDIVHLDGMPEPTDEVYAKVWVTPVLPRADFQISRILEQAF